MTRGRLGKKRIDLKGGEFFTIPLDDSSFGLGQFAKDKKKSLDSCICVFYSNTFTEKPDSNKLSTTELEPIAVLLVTRENLVSGRWNIICEGNVKKLRKGFLFRGSAYSKLRKLERLKTTVGIKIYGAGNIRNLLNAYHGQKPWTMMKNPTYFDDLLLPGCIGPLKKYTAT